MHTTGKILRHWGTDFCCQGHFQTGMCLYLISQIVTKPQHREQGDSIRVLRSTTEPLFLDTTLVLKQKKNYLSGFSMGLPGLTFSKSGSDLSVVSQIQRIWRGRTEPEPNFENITQAPRASAILYTYIKPLGFSWRCCIVLFVAMPPSQAWAENHVVAPPSEPFPPPKASSDPLSKGVELAHGVGVGEPPC